MRLRQPSRRTGFTLVELLVVLSIIIVLLSLIVAGVMSFMSSGPYTASQTNMKTILQKVKTQWQAVHDKARRETIPSSMHADLMALAGTTRVTDSRTRDKYVEYRLAQAFPTTFSEAITNYGGKSSLPPWDGYVRFFTGNGITAANVATNTTPADAQLAVCLLVAVDRGPLNTGTTADSWGSSAIGKLTIKSDAGADVQVDGFVDGWRRPILFTRGYGGTANTPALLSAGKDGKLGVNLSTFGTTTQNDARDNIVVTNP